MVPKPAPAAKAGTPISAKAAKHRLPPTRNSGTVQLSTTTSGAALAAKLCRSDAGRLAPRKATSQLS